MSEEAVEQHEYLSQRGRLLALALYVFLLMLASWIVTDEVFPAESGRRLWLLSGIALWFFSLLSAPWFRPPRNSLTNAVSAVLMMCFIDFNGVASLERELSLFRWFAVGVSVMVSAAAIVAMVFQETDRSERPRLAYMSILSYRLSDALGRGEVIFTPPALVSIVGYYQAVPMQQLVLLFLWVFLVSVRPIELAIKLVAQGRRMRSRVGGADLIGTISRIDHPGVVRVALRPAANWNSRSVTVACLPNGSQVQLLPLYTQVQEAQLVGTGLCCGKPDSDVPGALPGHVYGGIESAHPDAIMRQLSGCAEGAELIGFVVEGSSISEIKFEVSPDAHLEEGLLTFCRQGGEVIYYQILDAHTAEETFEQNPSGKHVVIAAQLGCLDSERGFVKYGWLPAMNCPVFAAKQPVKFDMPAPEPDEFVIGKVPGSDISVRAGFFDLLEYHTAILGVTGTGKTELAFDIIGQALSLGAKVFCVDFTNEYKARLGDKKPQTLGLDQKQAEELDEKLFAVETGEFGAKKEKEALKKFVNEIRDPVGKNVEQFLSSPGASLGVFELPEITNTKATLRATELYLSSIMDWARKNRRARKILVVLEEAHTIIPETAGSGFDYDTQWIVGKISQIALQGRKYGVGLLIVSQRTALVSKSILSQCNTCIAFSLVDKTSLDYLSNVYSSAHILSIPNLRFLEAIAYGKAIRSERPLLVKLEYVQAKKDACEALNKTVKTNGGK